MNIFSSITYTLHAASQASLYYYPLIFLGIAAFVMLALGIRNIDRKVFAGITFAAVLISMIMILLDPYDEVVVGNNALLFNRFTMFFAVILIISVLYIIFPAIRGAEVQA